MPLLSSIRPYEPSIESEAWNPVPRRGGRLGVGRVRRLRGTRDRQRSTTVTVAAKPSGTITVSAAASLTEAFTKIGKDFEKKYKGTTVTLNFGASSALVLQITQGAPADVFASADQANMDKAATAGKVTAPEPDFARNQLEIVVKKGNPEKIRTLADLADAGTISLCAVEVPCGKFAAQALQQAGVTIPESNITRWNRRQGHAGGGIAR